MSMTKPTSEQVTFLPAGAGAVQRNLVDKVRESISLADFGVVADGVTDDTSAFAAAIAAQQASGKTLVGIAGGNANLASWSRVTTSSPFYFDGNHMTVTCGNPTSVEFIDCQNDFDIRNTDFQQWFRVLDCQKTTNRIKLGIFSNNNVFGRRKLNPSTGAAISNMAWQISIQPYFDYILIENNKIDNSFVYGIHLGSQDAGYQDDVMYRRAMIIGNRILNVTVGSGPGSVYGCIFQGHFVEYLNNYIDTLNGSATALGGAYGNGCYGLYCKARYALVRGNYLKNIGTNTGLLAANEQWAINTKGASAVIEDNVIDTVGKESPDPAGGCIANDGSPRFIVRNNYCVNIGNGIVGGAGAIIDGNYLQLGNRVSPYPGVISSSSQSNLAMTVISNNVIEALPGHTATTSAAIRVDSYTAPDGGNALVVGNQILNVPATALIGSTGFYTIPIVGVRFERNRVYGCSGGFVHTISTAIGPSEIWHINNTIENVTTPAGISSVAGITIRDVIGYVTRNTGKATAIASGATVTHGLIGTPELVFVTPLSSGVTDVTVTNLTSTTFVINFGGGGTKDFAWDAQHARYNGRI